MLFCAYVGAVYGAGLPDAELREAEDGVADLRARIVISLREARRAPEPHEKEIRRMHVRRRNFAQPSRLPSFRPNGSNNNAGTRGRSPPGRSRTRKQL